MPDFDMVCEYTGEIIGAWCDGHPSYFEPHPLVSLGVKRREDSPKPFALFLGLTTVVVVGVVISRYCWRRFAGRSG
jgi:hypothetical protein